MGLSFLIVHEMDAIRCKEWSIFPGLSLLSDKVGQRVLVFVRIPLFFMVFYQLTFNTNNDGFIQGFNIFMVLQLGMHLIFLGHEKNRFKDWLSWILIAGAGVFAIADLLVNG